MYSIVELMKPYWNCLCGLYRLGHYGFKVSIPDLKMADLSLLYHSLLSLLDFDVVILAAQQMSCLLFLATPLGRGFDVNIKILGLHSYVCAI